MPETNQQREKQPKKKPKPPGHWGIDDLTALQSFQAQKLEVHLRDGCTVSGDLVGYGSFSLQLKVGDRIIVVNKGAISWYTVATAQEK